MHNSPQFETMAVNEHLILRKQLLHVCNDARQNPDYGLAYEAYLGSCLVDQSLGGCHKHHNAIWAVPQHPIHAEAGDEGFAT